MLKREIEIYRSTLAINNDFKYPTVEIERERENKKACAPFPGNI
jgi:hypothetical protein